MTPEETFDHLDKRVDSILLDFEKDFAGVLSRAQTSVILNLRNKLTLTDQGKIAGTAANYRIISGIPKMFEASLDAAGYQNLLRGFLSRFDGGLPTLESMISSLARDKEIKPVIFSEEDQTLFDQVKLRTAATINDVVNQAGQAAKRNVLFMLGGRTFEQAAVEISQRLQVALGESESLAATGISSFYRTVADRGYQIIETSLEKIGRELRYRFYGPPASDPLIRPFCEALMTRVAAGRTWDRAEIDAMDNHQLPDVFITGGGWNCRHQWITASEGKEKEAGGGAERVRGSSEVPLTAKARAATYQMALAFVDKV
jgi:hypothetical protein